MCKVLQYFRRKFSLTTEMSQFGVENSTEFQKSHVRPCKLRYHVFKKNSTEIHDSRNRISFRFATPIVPGVIYRVWLARKKSNLYDTERQLKVLGTQFKVNMNIRQKFLCKENATEF